MKRFRLEFETEYNGTTCITEVVISGHKLTRAVAADGHDPFTVFVDGVTIEFPEAIQEITEEVIA